IVRENRFPLMSFTEICQRKLKRREVIVRELFPDLAKRISRRYRDTRKVMADIRQEQFCAGLKAAARALHSRGVVPNHKTLKPYVSPSTNIRCEWAIAALRNVRMELGYESAEEQLLLPVGFCD